MDIGGVDVNKHAQNERCHYPAISIEQALIVHKGFIIKKKNTILLRDTAGNPSCLLG